MYNAKTYMCYVCWILDAQEPSDSNYNYATYSEWWYSDLPSLGVVFAQSLAEVLVPACVDALLVFLVHVYFLRVLLQIRDVVCCVPALKYCVRCLGLLLTFPEEVLAKTDRKLSCEHVSTCRPRREGLLMRGCVRGGHNDRLGL